MQQEKVFPARIVTAAWARTNLKKRLDSWAPQGRKGGHNWGSSLVVVPSGVYFRQLDVDPKCGGNLLVVGSPVGWHRSFVG